MGDVFAGFVAFAVVDNRSFTHSGTRLTLRLATVCLWLSVSAVLKVSEQLCGLHRELVWHLVYVFHHPPTPTPDTATTLLPAVYGTKTDGNVIPTKVCAQRRLSSCRDARWCVCVLMPSVNVIGAGRKAAGLNIKTPMFSRLCKILILTWFEMNFERALFHCDASFVIRLFLFSLQRGTLGKLQSAMWAIRSYGEAESSQGRQ